MQQRKGWLMVIIILISLFIQPTNTKAEESNEETLISNLHSMRETQIQALDQIRTLARFTYDSGYHFPYPEAVRGIYVTGHSAGGARFRAEEHTSEIQSRGHLLCRLLLETR